MEKGKLYIVATPIGNLKDITLRAIEILKSVDYIACEDTRKTGFLLKALEIERKSNLFSYYDQTEESKTPHLLNILNNGFDVALVSDSGTPLISDPGYKLVREVIKAGVKVESIPGPSAVISALVSSGLPPDKFLFLGFLPKKDGHRESLLTKVKDTNSELESTIIFYEAPHKLIKTLKTLEKVFGNINLTFARELTKIYEEVIQMSVNEAINFYEKKAPRGEFVVLFNPKV